MAVRDNIPSSGVDVPEGSSIAVKSFTKQGVRNQWITFDTEGLTPLSLVIYIDTNLTIYSAYVWEGEKFVNLNTGVAYGIQTTWDESTSQLRMYYPYVSDNRKYYLSLLCGYQLSGSGSIPTHDIEVQHVYSVNDKSGTFTIDTQGNLPVTVSWWENDNRNIYAAKYNKRTKQFTSVDGSSVTSLLSFDENTSIVTITGGSRTYDLNVICE